MIFSLIQIDRKVLCWLCLWVKRTDFIENFYILLSLRKFIYKKIVCNVCKRINNICIYQHVYVRPKLLLFDFYKIFRIKVTQTGVNYHILVTQNDYVFVCQTVSVDCWVNVIKDCHYCHLLTFIKRQVTQSHRCHYY